MPTTMHKIVGSVRWEPVRPVCAGGQIQLLDGWERDNIISVSVPQLDGVKTFGGSFGSKVRFYRGAAEQLQAAWAEVERSGLMNRVLFWSGSCVERLQRTSTTKPSNHAFGTAFDINHEWNGLGSAPAAVGNRGCVRELVPIFEQFGFLWGGRWTNPDGMHFEVKKLLTPRPAVEEVAIVVDGTPLSVKAEVREGRSWAPARIVGEALGASVRSWDAGTSSVKINDVPVPGELRGGKAWARIVDVARAAGAPPPTLEENTHRIILQRA